MRSLRSSRSVGASSGLRPGGPIPEAIGEAVAHFQPAASRRGNRRRKGRTKAGGTGGVVGDDVKQRSDNFSDT
jgi:hypothetical protein